MYKEFTTSEIEAVILKVQEYENNCYRICLVLRIGPSQNREGRKKKYFYFTSTSGEVEKLVNMSNSSGKQNKTKKRQRWQEGDKQEEEGLLFVQAGVVIWDSNTIADLSGEIYYVDFESILLNQYSKSV